MEIEAEIWLNSFGILCLLFIDNVQFLTQICGKLMKKYFPQKDLSKLAKKLERLLILRDLITRFVNAFLDWFVKLYLFQKNQKITSGRF
ncbi:hypothetical protein AY599_01355 [Leptolyngbya valderiana BDU 20041]|nr:hypothetical protein AY599_01355 [Leptolyngbya valderiana BDU 20041]